MNNPIDGRDPFEEDQLRWDRERLEAERLEAERLAGEQAEYEEAEFETEEPSAQLRLADEDERLPWLETDDDYADEAVDTGRIAMVAILGLLAVLAVVGLAWWLSRDQPDQELLAEGSTIEAPEGAIRDRPANPGGEPVEGTGDVSFEVGQGREGGAPAASPTPAASASAAASPSIDRNQAGAAATGAAATTGAATGGARVQIAAYSSQAAAETGWNQQTRQHSALSGMNHRIEQANVDGNTVYRLQAVAGSASAAEQLCRAIKSGGGDCRVVN